MTSPRDFHHDDRTPDVGRAHVVATMCFVLAWIFGVLGLIGSIVVAAATSGHTGAGAFFVFLWSLGGTMVLVTILSALGFILRFVIDAHVRGNRRDAAQRRDSSPPRSPGTLPPAVQADGPDWVRRAPSPTPSSTPPSDTAPTCPNCEMPMATDPSWEMWKCTSCDAPLCAVQCRACGGAYIAVWTNWTTCRRCHADWGTNVHTITLGELRAKASVPESQ